MVKETKSRMELALGMMLGNGLAVGTKQAHCPSELS